MKLDKSPRLVVNFHGVGDPWPGVSADEKPFWCPEHDWLTIADGLAVLTERTGLPLEITFDDGNVSDYELALPALLDRGLTATFFPCAARTGQPRYLSSEQLVALRQAGMSIGSHGWAHTDLRRLDDAALTRETIGSRDALIEASRGPVDSFAIPFGSYDRRVLNRLGSYQHVYTSDRALAMRQSWLTPRYSYTRDWHPGTPLRLAQERPSMLSRVRQAAMLTVKRLR